MYIKGLVPPVIVVVAAFMKSTVVAGTRYSHLGPT